MNDECARMDCDGKGLHIWTHPPCELCRRKVYDTPMEPICASGDESWCVDCYKKVLG